MTDYSDWTETEIPHEEYRRTPVSRRGFDERIRAGERVSTTYFRLDPPAPKYREGEMRWVTVSWLAGRRLMFRVGNGWSGASGGDAWLIDGKDRIDEISEPVVVVPAPTDEERADFLVHWTENPDDYDVPANQYGAKLVRALRNQEARNE